MGFVLEIPCRATLAKAARRSSLAARFLGYPVETRGKLRRQVAVCGRKPGAGQFGDKSRRLAIPGRNECVDLVTPNRTPWRALLRQRRGFPRAGADPFDRNGAGLRPARVGRHGGRPSNIPRTRRGSAYRKPWRAMLRQRPFFPRASVALSDGMGAGLRPAEVGRHGGRPSSFITNAARQRLSKTLEGDAPSAPIFPARQRGFVGRNGAGPRPAKIGRHGGRPSKATAASGLPALRLRLQARQPSGFFFLHPSS